VLYKIIQKSFFKGINIDRDHWLKWDMIESASSHSIKDNSSLVTIKIIINDVDIKECKGNLTRDDTRDYLRNIPTTRIRLFYGNEVAKYLEIDKSLIIDFQPTTKTFIFKIDDELQKDGNYKSRGYWSYTRTKAFLIEIAQEITGDASCMPSKEIINKHGSRFDKFYIQALNHITKPMHKAKKNLTWVESANKYGFEKVLININGSVTKMNVSDYLGLKK
tara:strand:- start:1046 stop:1705 length:660 start_codon:yes stop_codon:yes gene_type:complete